MTSIRKSAGAFTLIELLIVVALIAALISITVVVGTKVISTGKKNATENVIQILDIALQSVSEGSRGIPATVTIPEFEVEPGVSFNTPALQTVWPMSDLRNFGYVSANDSASPYMINSVGLFMYYVARSGNETAKVALSKLPQKFTGLYDPDSSPDGSVSILKVVSRSGDVRYWDGSQFELMTAFDGWGNPIRMVHPALDGIVGRGAISTAMSLQPIEMTEPEFSGIRANVSGNWQWGSRSVRRDFRARSNGAIGSGNPTADSDAGQCEGATPYFYSSGADELVGVQDDVNHDSDNVYTRVPRYPAARKTYEPDPNP